MKQHRISEKTQLVGIMGWPVDDCFSPAMHNAAFAEAGLDWAYVPLAVQPKQIEPALKGLVALNFIGANINAPHKQAIMRYLDELSDAARVTGAVNTIHLRNGKIHGYNTDAVGFLNALKETGCDPKGMRVAVLGAGEAARAAIFSLARREAEAITVYNRTAERAAFLVDDLREAFPDSRLEFKALNAETLLALQNQVDLVVNTTSAGMVPDSDSCPWPAEVPMPPQTIFYDLVFNPLETLFLRRAQQAGAATIDGLGMFIHQGAFAFEKWTGQPAPVATMRRACLEKLALP
jgi:shikimate dehydrogenase